MLRENIWKMGFQNNIDSPGSQQEWMSHGTCLWGKFQLFCYNVFLPLKVRWKEFCKYLDSHMSNYLPSGLVQDFMSVSIPSTFHTVQILIAAIYLSPQEWELCLICLPGSARMGVPDLNPPLAVMYYTVSNASCSSGMYNATAWVFGKCLWERMDNLIDGVNIFWEDAWIFFYSPEW